MNTQNDTRFEEGDKAVSRAAVSCTAIVSRREAWSLSDKAHLIRKEQAEGLLVEAMSFLHDKSGVQREWQSDDSLQIRGSERAHEDGAHRPRAAKYQRPTRRRTKGLNLFALSVRHRQCISNTLHELHGTCRGNRFGTPILTFQTPMFHTSHGQIIQLIQLIQIIQYIFQGSY